MRVGDKKVLYEQPRGDKGGIINHREVDRKIPARFTAETNGRDGMPGQHTGWVWASGGQAPGRGMRGCFVGTDCAWVLLIEVICLLWLII